MRARRDDDEEIIPDFTPEQRKQLLEMLEAKRFSTKAWGIVRTWVTYIAAALAALVSAKVLLSDWIKFR